jgi:hypothetical protein
VKVVINIHHLLHPTAMSFEVRTTTAHSLSFIVQVLRGHLFLNIISPQT